MRAVLVVEDDGDLLFFLAETLGIDGWTVLTAQNAPEALAVGRQFPVDVVLTDVRLGGTDGSALEQQFRADAALQGTPFVFMTGSKAEAERMGLEHALMKPFSAEELCARLRDAVESTRADL
jgi:DNA-binding response OmpR family regulator